MLIPDTRIKELAEAGMICPFIPEAIRKVISHKKPTEILKVMSYGLGHYGYDIRLSAKEFKLFQHVPGTVINPKNFNPANLVDAHLETDDYGEFFILPAHSYGLGVAVERLDIPDNITIICIGKSSYARSGIITNLTPAEAGWKGHLTLEICNSSSADVRIYAGEGIAQLLFFESDPCEFTYEDKKGKYQDQSEEVTTVRI